jgi:hypothetical protein
VTPGVALRPRTQAYEVLRVQSADDVRLRAYRIKSKAEPFERSVREYEILAIPETRDVFAGPAD